MRSRTLIAVVAALVIIPACTSAAARKHKEKRYKARFGYEEWHEGVRERGLDPSQLVYPFAVTPEIVQWADAIAGRSIGGKSVSRLAYIQDAMFNSSAFGFDYNDELTLTAVEAFEQRRGNCLAFTLLFVAATRSIGLDTYLVSVKRPPEVEKKGDLIVVNDHVVAGFDEVGRMHLYDFYMSSDIPYFQQKVVDDIATTALYYNNLGGDAIREGDYEEAIRHLTIATRLAPQLAAGWINLGVARHRLDDMEGAIDAYNRALEVDPGHSSALANLAYVYKRMGREEKARKVLEEAARRKSTPFALISLADFEISRGNLDMARTYLVRARRIDRKEPEVYLAMARLANKMGDIVTAAKLRNQAAKLDEMRQQRQQVLE